MAVFYAARWKESTSRTKGGAATFTKITNAAKVHTARPKGELANWADGGRDGRMQLRAVAEARRFFCSF